MLFHCDKLRSVSWEFAFQWILVVCCWQLYSCCKLICFDQFALTKKKPIASKCFFKFLMWINSASTAFNTQFTRLKIYEDLSLQQMRKKINADQESAFDSISFRVLSFFTSDQIMSTHKNMHFYKKYQQVSFSFVLNYRTRLPLARESFDTKRG